MAFQVFFHHCEDAYREKIETAIREFAAGDFRLAVKSSGSTGTPKQIFHSKTAVVQSAERTNSYFNLTESSRVLCPISFDTIGGKMSLFRAMVGDYEVHFTTPSRHFVSDLPGDLAFDLVSLAPIQLDYIIKNQPDKLPGFKQILLGGSAVSAELEEDCLELNLNVNLGFGMTETVSHFAIRKMGNPVYSVLAGFEVNATDSGMEIRDVNNHSIITSTDSIEYIDKHHFKWIGRLDFVINTGGVKIHPEPIEQLISNRFGVQVVLIGLQDSEYGEKVVLVTENQLTQDLKQSIDRIILTEFGKYAVPKQYIRHSFSYLNGLKLDRKTIKAQIEQL